MFLLLTAEDTALPEIKETKQSGQDQHIYGISPVGLIPGRKYRERVTADRRFVTQVTLGPYLEGIISGGKVGVVLLRFFRPFRPIPVESLETIAVGDTILR